MDASVHEQAVADLRAVYNAGVVHRGLELRNLVFDGEKIKFIYFGNAGPRSEYAFDIHSFKKDKDKDLKQLKLVLSWLWSLDW